MQLTVRMDEESKRKLELLSESMGLKRADIVRLALRQFLDENLQEKERKPFDKVAHLLGIVQSGISDLRQKHRERIIRKLRAGS